MKNILLLLIFIPITSFAKFHEGEIIFNNGNIKKGYIEIPDDSENSKIKFKEVEKGKTEKFPLELINSFVINGESKQNIKYIIKHLAYFNPFSKENKFRKHNKLACLRIIREGKVSLCSAWFLTTGAGGGAVGGATVTSNFMSGETFIYREGNDYALEFYEGNPKGFNISMNSFKYLKEMITKHFSAECPLLVELVSKEDLKKNGLVHILELYELNCK